MRTKPHQGSLSVRDKAIIAYTIFKCKLKPNNAKIASKTSLSKPMTLIFIKRLKSRRRRFVRSVA